MKTLAKTMKGRNTRRKEACRRGLTQELDQHSASAPVPIYQNVYPSGNSQCWMLSTMIYLNNIRIFTLRMSKPHFWATNLQHVQKYLIKIYTRGVFYVKILLIFN